MSSPPDHPIRRKNPGQALWDHARYPRQWWLLGRMLGWYGLLHLLRLSVKTEKLIRTAAPSPGIHSTTAPADIIRYLGWITVMSTRLPGPTSNCLVQALVGYRFLSQTGTVPDLIIGFNGPQGHAWLEMDGQPVFPLRNHYRPTLRLNPHTQRLEPVNTPQTPQL